MNNDMIIKETSVWGNAWKVKNPYKRLRLIKKAEILGWYPFVDHETIYSYKPKNQRGPAKEEQTFILSFACEDAFESANVDDFISKLNEIGLLFYKEKCVYKTHNAYKIIIYENMCPINEILQKI